MFLYDIFHTILELPFLGLYPIIFVTYVPTLRPFRSCFFCFVARFLFFLVSGFCFVSGSLLFYLCIDVVEHLRELCDWTFEFALCLLLFSGDTDDHRLLGCDTG